MNKLYAIFVDEGIGEKLVFDANYIGVKGKRRLERRFFFGGSSLMACIFSTSQAAYIFIKQNDLIKDFKKESQYYVRRIEITESN